ncbi:MAG: acetyl-CoA carboxylase biotin carboxyl carrier protein subunit [Elusimicrobia bacterium HGW-Elusimicrobia-1]|jgi:acetyl-CoA carboxylase biotin carboxyl carrier protein|nr:MAG: acetyl-CoA carboxylase biotin carboxyl carrier protein subunit [Elusimicrobia bacterium HGW-Elusimicrobia-1]
MKNVNVSKDAASETVSGKENGRARLSPVAEKVKDAYGSMCDEGLLEMEIKEGDVAVYIRRAGADDAVESSGRAADDSRRRAAAPSSVPQKEPALPAGRNLTSPINGIFYRSSSPKSPPFSSEGDTVDAGKTLCIIEAMKVMNEIKADSRVKIVKILVENGIGVTQGQPIMLVE